MATTRPEYDSAFATGDSVVDVGKDGAGGNQGCTDAENGTAGPGLETLCLGPRFCLRETPAVGSTVSRYREHSAANTAKTRVSRQHTVCVVQETHLWEALSLSLWQRSRVHPSS